MFNFAAITLGAGVAIVVIVLIIVIGAVSRRNAGKESQAQPAETPALAAQDLGTEPARGMDAKTVAVIMAAVAAAMGCPAEQLHFRAIRRDGGIKSAWAGSGTYEIIHTRQQYL